MIITTHLKNIFPAIAQNHCIEKTWKFGTRARGDVNVREKGSPLSAGQYFDIKIDYVNITEDEFNAQMKADMDELESMFAESHRLEDEIRLQLNRLKFGG